MVFLREFLPEDRERMLDILTSRIIRRTYMLPDFTDREAAVPLFLRLMEMSHDKDKFIRAIADEDGVVGFINHTEITRRQIELGYVIHPDFHGKGYMTEALKHAMDELFSLGYEEIVACAFSSNTASIRVMEKCGMTPLVKTDEIEYRGITHTCVYYSKNRE